MTYDYAYDYAIIRVVPKVKRGEFTNVGMTLSYPAQEFLEAQITSHEQRIRALDTSLDIKTVREQLTPIPAICTAGKHAGLMAQLPQRER